MAALIKYNADTGSNTLASGMGPAHAIVGTMHTNGVSSSTYQLSVVSTAVASGDMIWIDVGGTQLLEIFSIDTGAMTVTTGTPKTVDASSPVAFAIGGVREHPGGTPEAAAGGWTDVKSAGIGGVLELQDCVSDYELGTTILVNTTGNLGGGVTIRAAAGASPVMRWTGTSQSSIQDQGYLTLEGLTIVNDEATGLGARGIYNTGKLTKVINCTIRTGRPLFINNGELIMSGCDIESTVGMGIDSDNARLIITDTVFHDCPGLGADVNGEGDINIFGCTFRDNGTAGIDIDRHTGARMVDIANNVFYNNTGGGVLMSGLADDRDGPFSIYNNIFSQNGAPGIAQATVVNKLTAWSDFNAFYSNTGGEVSNIVEGEHSATLSVDPFVDAAGGDFTLNEAGGGGALCRDTALRYGDNVTWGPKTNTGYPIVKYNADTGNDTQASGAGPIAGVFGTNGDQSASTLTLNGTFDFTGAAEDGTDLAWVEFTPGSRHLYVVAAFIGGVSTCTALTINGSPGTGTGMDWAVGGVRKTLEADTGRPDTQEAAAGWTYELQESTADYVSTVTWPIFAGNLTGGPITIQAAAGASPTITWTATAALFQTAVNPRTVEVRGVTLRNTTAVSSSANCLNSGGGLLRALGCTMESHRPVHNNAGRSHLVDCDVQSIGDIALNAASGARATAIASKLTGGTLPGFYSANSGGAANAASCEITSGSSSGLLMFATSSSNKPFVVRNSVMYNASGAGIVLSGTVNIGSGPYVFLNNVFHSNGGYGINIDGGTSVDLKTFSDHNAYYNNTSGEVSTDITLGSNSISSVGDPFVSAATGDFRLNVTDGAPLVATGIPASWDIGVIQTSGNKGVDQSPSTARDSAPEAVVNTPLIEYVDYRTRVQLGRVPGWAVLAASGEYEGAGNTATGEDIWRASDLTPAGPLELPTPIAAGEAMTLVSTSDSDGRVGIGARSLVIDYLDASGAEQQEILALQGTSPVDMLASNVRFVQRIQVASAGSLETAAGDIRIYKKGGSSTTDLYNFILAGDNSSMISSRMVPAGKTLFLQEWSVSEAQSKKVAFRLRSTDSAGVVIPDVYLAKSTNVVTNNTTGEVALNTRIPELSILKVSVWPDLTGSDGSAHWWGFLVDNV